LLNILQVTAFAFLTPDPRRTQLAFFCFEEAAQTTLIHQTGFRPWWWWWWCGGGGGGGGVMVVVVVVVVVVQGRPLQTPVRAAWGTCRLCTHYNSGTPDCERGGFSLPCIVLITSFFSGGAVNCTVCSLPVHCLFTA
jgi:hypothetical protein